MREAGKFKARIILGPEVWETEVWDDEFTPTENGHRSVREWAQEYLVECMSPEDYLLEIGLAKTQQEAVSLTDDGGSHLEILLEAAIVSSGPDRDGEYDTCLEDCQWRYKEVPGEWVKDRYILSEDVIGAPSSIEKGLTQARYFGQEAEANDSNWFDYRDDVAHYYGKPWDEIPKEDQELLLAEFKAGRKDERETLSKMVDWP